MIENDQHHGLKKRFECVFCKQALTLISDKKVYICNNKKCVSTIPPQLEYEAEIIEHPKTQKELDVLWSKEEARLNNLRKIYSL